MRFLLQLSRRWHYASTVSHYQYQLPLFVFPLFLPFWAPARACAGMQFGPSALSCLLSPTPLLLPSDASFLSNSLTSFFLLQLSPLRRGSIVQGGRTTSRPSGVLPLSPRAGLFASSPLFVSEVLVGVPTRPLQRWKHSPPSSRQPGRPAV